MGNKDQSKQSFSSFADLQNLRVQLRQKEADEAQRKADAIEVDKSREHLNPLKQKAARLAQWSSSAQNATSSQSAEKNADKNAVHNERNHNRSNERHELNERTERSRRSDSSIKSDTSVNAKSSGSFKNNNNQDAARNTPRTRSEQEDDAKRLERALGRLQRKVEADQAERHGVRGLELDNKNSGRKEQNARNTHKDRSYGEGAYKAQGEAKFQDKAGNRNARKSEAVKEQRNGKNQARRTAGTDKSRQRPGQIKNNQALQLLRECGITQDHFYDAQMLKVVRDAADHVSYQDRRQIYNKLRDLDKLILVTVRELTQQDRVSKVTDESQQNKSDAQSATKQLTLGSEEGASVGGALANENEATPVGSEVKAQDAVQEQNPVVQTSKTLVLAQETVVQEQDKEDKPNTSLTQTLSLSTSQPTDNSLSLWDRIMADAKINQFKLELSIQIEEAQQRLKQHQENLPKLEYPENLPVSQRREEIVKAIQTHQVVIIAGETGSGKTTQIPKMCLEAGYGRKGLIGHTQPRRIAARAVAARIASEMHEELGHSVSYKVRFTDISSPDAYIKLMTDGILLSELSSDRLLLDYEVVIVDEAHERSLNIDFLLGYLKGLLQKRPELKLIITSATIDVERFSEHFNHAPIIEVSGRTYPVEVVYMPLMEDGRGVYIEDQSGKGRYETDHKSLNHIIKSADDPELTEGPGAWHDYQMGSKAEMLSAASRASQGIRAAQGAGAGSGVGQSKRAAKVPRIDDDDRDVSDVLDLRQGILQAIHYLERRGRGDILVFLPGERDILELSQFLRKSQLRDTEIVPLYARLATQEQNKIFTEHTGMRIVLSTNVAETSLTVPGIKYVIDPGLARISRYSSRTKVQRLPIEPISQASANQRKGRCGRVSDGICVRLYSKEDFESRPEFTDPEILRTNLASVLLQMASLRLGRVENFPFIDAPQPRQVSDGLRLLHELGAVQDTKFKDFLQKDAAHKSDSTAVNSGVDQNERVDQSSSRQFNDGHDSLRLTAIGQALSRLPCDPRLGRMILEADKHNALTEVLIIVSALAVMDPREYPLDKKEAATNCHKRFVDEKSDFLSYLKLYDYIRKLQGELSNSALRRQLKQEYISFLRTREWLDVLRQLRASAHTLSLKFNEAPASYEEIHRSLISGLLSQLGMLEPNGNNYIGARGSKFVIFPGSGLAKKPPKWICACELAETSRLFARTVAAIDPNYAEEVGEHLIKNSYNEPHWSKKSGAVIAYLTRSIYGLPIVQKRQVQYQHVDPRLCHELMIRDGLVGGNVEQSLPFLEHNLELISDVEYLEDKVRRRDLLVDAAALEQFYQERIPESICNMRDFATWWRQKSKDNSKFLDFDYELISKQDISLIEEEQYPEYWKQGNLRLQLSYVFDIGSDRDGVTVHIPVTVLNQIRADDFLWQIEGLRQELFAALIRSLPKRLRRNLIPAPEYAKALNDSLSVYTQLINPREQTAVSALPPAPGKKHQAAAQAQAKSEIANKARAKVDNLFVVVARELTRMGGELISADDFDKSMIEPYLFMNFAIEGVNGEELAFGKDFNLLAERLQSTAREALHQVVKTHQIKPPAQSWDYGTIKRQQVTTQGTLKITAYPALTDRGDGVTLELYDSPERQAKAMRQGAIKLLALSLKTPAAYLETHLPNRSKLAMYYQPLGSIKELIFDLMMCAIGNIMDRNGGTPWDEEHFARLKEIVRGEMNDEALAVAKLIEKSLMKAHELKHLLKGNISLDLTRTYSDLNHQLDALVYKGFISESGMDHLQELPRYLEAAVERVSRAQRDVVRDQICMRTLENVEDEYLKVMNSYHAELMPQPLKDVKWMIQELRVSYFAQHLGVNGPISDKRIYQELERIQKEWPPQK